MNVTVVTGAASGIGRAITEPLVAAGEAVVGVDVDGDGLEALQARIGATHR
jgi:NADP-dependent 3-hydroxy acid dehydrogenase YdfG